MEVVTESGPWEGTKSDESAIIASEMHIGGAPFLEAQLSPVGHVVVAVQRSGASGKQMQDSGGRQERRPTSERHLRGG